MNPLFELKATFRKDTGKSASRRLRRNHQPSFIPAVIYGKKKTAKLIVLNHNHILHALEKELFYSAKIIVKIEEEHIEQVILKNVQYHPYKPSRILHLDFLRS